MNRMGETQLERRPGIKLQIKEGRVPLYPDEDSISHATRERNVG